LLKQLDYKIVNPDYIKFISYAHPEGRRTYARSLSFVLQVAVRHLFPDLVLIIDYSLPNGLYCELRRPEPLDNGRPDVVYLTDEQIESIIAEMQRLIDANLLFSKQKMLTEDAIKIFEKNNQPAKAELKRSLGTFLTTVYKLDDVIDTFYGPLVPSTGYITKFGIVPFGDGFCLQYPVDMYMKSFPSSKRQSKIADTMKEHSNWCQILGAKGIGMINEAVRYGGAKMIINLVESRHERDFARIADMIYQRRDSVKVVFIAGPSSSGKTSSSLRLALQLKVLGLNPRAIELDNYFVERSRTPKDEKGEYDYECLEAMDLELLRQNLDDLFAGKSVVMPRFDFKQGIPVFDTEPFELGEKDILIMEGIHALNPAMSKGIDNSKIFRIFASALTSLSIDENNNIVTSDNRLLRRIVRDNQYRGHSPEATLSRWDSVMRGEELYISPYREHADVFFNSASIIEIPVLKYYAEPLLRMIQPNSPVYTDAVRLLNFLSYVTPLSPEEIKAIPPTSILREFIGGQNLVRF